MVEQPPMAVDLGGIAGLVDLLRKAIAWRSQGNLSAWKTAPSRELAVHVDRLLEHSAEMVRRLAPEEWERARFAAGIRRPAPYPAAPCGWEDCDQEARATLSDGTVMCEHHAAVALLARMAPGEARSTFRFARPVPEDPWRGEGEAP